MLPLGLFLLGLKGCDQPTDLCGTYQLATCQACRNSEVFNYSNCECTYRVHYGTGTDRRPTYNQTADELCRRFKPINADGSYRCDGDCRNYTLPPELVLGENESCDCEFIEVAAGRALITENGSRRASLHQGPCQTGWISLPEKQKSRKVNRDLSSHFKSIGLAEHASVASFARVVMELLQLAAPADLVDRTLLAGREEVRHAQMALSLARSWSVEDFHVGPLEGLELPPVTLIDLARQTVFEAVAGETPAALAAKVALRFAQDHAVRNFLQLVAVEERRHAELAWATLAWAIQRGKTPVLEAALAALEVAEAKLMQSVIPSEGNLAYGILSSTLDLAIRHEAATLLKSLRLELSDLWNQELSTFENYVRQAFDKSITRLDDVQNEQVL